MEHHLINALNLLHILIKEIFSKISQTLSYKIIYLLFRFFKAYPRFFCIHPWKCIINLEGIIFIHHDVVYLQILCFLHLILLNLQLKFYKYHYKIQIIMLSRTYTYVFLFVMLTFTLSKVPEVSVNNFDGSLFFVQVYQDGCQNCNAQLNEIQDVSKLFEGILKVGKINLKNIPAMKGQKLPKNPSYFFVKGSIQDFSQYKQKISRISISKFILSQMEKLIKSRDSKLFGGKKSSSEGSSSQGTKNKNANQKGGSAQKDSSGVTVLTDANFQSTVLSSDEAWFVEFYSPSCGHCVALQPEWDKLPARIGKRVRIAKIDATVNRQMASKFQIKGFPTLLFFGVDDKSTPVPYNSQRTADAMVSWLLTQKIAEEKLQFLKLTKQAYDKQCNRNIVCLIFILQKKSELKQLDFIQQVMQNNKGKPLRFFYSSRLQKFEQTLMIEDRSTPKLVSVWDSLNSYRIYNSGLNEKDLNQYISKIMERKSWIKLSQKVGQTLFADNPTASEL